MRKIFVIAALLFGAVPLMIQAKSPVPVKKQYKHPLIEQKLDSIIFPQITVENVTLESVLLKSAAAAVRLMLPVPESRSCFSGKNIPRTIRHICV